MKKIIVLFALCVIFFSCEKKKALNKIEYTIDCEDCSLTYENSVGGIEQVSSARSGWKYNFTGAPGDLVYLSAQNKNNYGEVTVTILRDGEEFKKATSSGAYVIATARGNIPED